MFRRYTAVLAVAVAAGLAACSQSDIGITTAVKSRLAADAAVQAQQIDVDTSNRVVTLRGTVTTAEEKDRAVMLARQTDGVRNVVDEISVGPVSSAHTTDTAGDTAHTAGQDLGQAAAALGDAAQTLGREAAEKAREAADRSAPVIADAAITAAVKSKLLADPDVKGLKIDVDTTGRVTTLSGTVGSMAEADRAAALTRGTDGVARVVNNLKVAR